MTGFSAPTGSAKGRQIGSEHLIVPDTSPGQPAMLRLACSVRGITPVIARRGTEHGSGLGTYRRVIEQSVALLHWFRRLRIRWEIRDDIHEAFLSLACAIICWRRLTNLSLC